MSNIEVLQHAGPGELSSFNPRDIRSDADRDLAAAILGNRLAEAKARMSEIQVEAQEHRRDLRASEQRQIDKLDAEAHAVQGLLGQFNAFDTALRSVPRAGARTSTLGGGSVFSVLRSSEWSLGQTATIPVASRALIADPDSANPLREPGILLTGHDARHIYPALPMKDAGMATSVDVLVSTGGSIAADVADLTSTAEKSVTDSGGTVTSFTMQRAATVSTFHPNALVQLPEFQQLVDDDMSKGYRDAIDGYVVTTLENDAGGGGTAGADLFQQIRKGRTAIEAEGFTPNLVAVSPSDAESLDLERAGGSTSGDGAFMLPPAPRNIASSPLWGMTVIAAKGVTDPIVLDTSTVQLYLGSATFSADSVTRFSTNESRFRLESPVLLVVKNPKGVYVIA